VGRLGRIFGYADVPVGSGFRAAVAGGHRCHGGLTSVALASNPLLLLTQLRIERAQRVIEALIERRATLIGCLRAIHGNR